MKKVFIFILMIISGLGFSVDFTMENYYTDITVNSDLAVDFSERITVNFLEKRHGIYRFIPINNPSYQPITITNLNVSQPFISYMSNQNMYIRIGEEDKYVTGIQSYDIDYTVTDAIYENGDEMVLNWNVIGTGWNKTIKHCAFIVHLEYSTDIEYKVYIGPYDSDWIVTSSDENDELFYESYPDSWTLKNGKYYYQNMIEMMEMSVTIEDDAYIFDYPVAIPSGWRMRVCLTFKQKEQI